MLRLSLWIPVIAFTVFGSWAADTHWPETWLNTAALVSFFAALIAIPVISRKHIGAGFLAVAIILGVLGYTFLVPHWSHTRNPQEASAILLVNYDIQDALAKFHRDIGSYPTPEQGLDALIRCPQQLEAKWKGPYLTGADRPHVLDDPWGHPYQYACPGIHNRDAYDVWSRGPDIASSRDDIGNWER
ncbi:MAG: hypothetical protein RIQ79_1962 [Verrucomicrobiota bacterium]